MASRVHIVRQGDCLASIAARHGVATVDELYEHPDNAELRQQRSSPHMLAPGDVVHLPPADAEAFTMEVGGVNRFRGRVARVPIEVVLRDRAGNPLANLRYELWAGGEPIAGTTDGNGAVRTTIPASRREATLLLLGDDGRLLRTLALTPGHLDPHDTESGARGRLHNLGYRDHDERAATTAFQRAEGLSETGELDDETQAKLRERHGI